MTLPTRNRLSFGATALDQMLGGGLLEGSATLVSGAPGVGKTTLGLQFLMAGVQARQTGLLVSFEEFPTSLIRDALQLGWDLKQLEKEGKIGIIFTSPDVLLESLKIGELGPIAQKIQTVDPSRVVFDSMAHFQRLTSNALELREIFNTLVNATKRQGMTSLMLDEAVKPLQTRQGQLASLPFLVDTVLLLRYVEVDSSIERAIAVMKMRGSAHQKEIRRFVIKRGGLEIGDPFTGREGILTGTTYRIS